MRDVLLLVGWPPVVVNAALTLVVVLGVVWVASMAALDQADWLAKHEEADR